MVAHKDDLEFRPSNFPIFPNSTLNLEPLDTYSTSPESPNPRRFL
jgi:hypothetical protein